MIKPLLGGFNLSTIAMCQFDTPPFIYYSYAIVFVLSFITAFLILFRNKKHPANRNAFIFIMIFALLIVNELLQWFDHDVLAGLFLARISNLAFFITLFFLYFSYYFVGRRPSLKEKLILAVPYVLAVPFVFTDFNIRVFNEATCDYADGPLVGYIFLVSIIYAVWSVMILTKKLKDPIVPYQIKAQIKILSGAIIFLVFSLIFAKEADSLAFAWNLDFDVAPYFIIANLFSISLIIFAIVDCNLFEFNTVPTKSFSLFVLTAVFSSMILFQISSSFVLITSILYVVLLIIYWKM